METSVQQANEKLAKLTRETQRVKNTQGYTKKLEEELAYNKEVIRMLQKEIAQLKEQVITDSLTGLCNSRVVIAEEIERAISSKKRRNKPKYYLLFVDLDDFKLVNDTHGHSAGDAALVYTANLFRNEEFAFRFGGDEFGLILPVQGILEVGRTISRITKGLKNFQWQGKCVPLSASIGYVEIMAGNSASEIIAKADKAMYERKKEE